MCRGIIDLPVQTYHDGYLHGGITYFSPLQLMSLSGSAIHINALHCDTKNIHNVIALLQFKFGVFSTPEIEAI